MAHLLQPKRLDGWEGQALCPWEGVAANVSRGNGYGQHAHCIQLLRDNRQPAPLLADKGRPRLTLLSTHSSIAANATAAKSRLQNRPASESCRIRTAAAHTAA